MRLKGKKALSTWVCSWIKALASASTCRSRLPKPSNVQPLWVGACPTLVVPGKLREGWWWKWQIWSCFIQFRCGLVPITTMLSRRTCSRHREVWCWEQSQLSCLTNLQEIALAMEAIRKDGRRRLVEKWQRRWHGDQSGRWTHRLIPELATWLDIKHGQVGYYLAQAFSGHGCFNAYLRRFKKVDDESCRYCRSLVENAEHALFVCARWGPAPAVLRLGWLGCPRQSGEESFYFSHGWRGYSVCLTSVWYTFRYW